MSFIFLRNKVATSSLDADASAYITAVETADGQALEASVRTAINDFVVGCKSDGIWTAISASCILAGARTLAGALVPLVGSAPTNNNFVGADYDRKTGLLGDASTKYIDSNRNNNADSQNNKHVAVYLSSKGAVGQLVVSAGWTGQTGETAMGFAGTTGYTAIHRAGWVSKSTLLFSGADNSLFGVSRSGSTTVNSRLGGVDEASSRPSESPFNGNINIFRADTGAFYSSARISFYSIGESLNLGDLEARISTLMADLGSAIP